MYVFLTNELIVILLLDIKASHNIVLIIDITNI
jgi:hypothetical protein